MFHCTNEPWFIGVTQWAFPVYQYFVRACIPTVHRTICLWSCKVFFRFCPSCTGQSNIKSAASISRPGRVINSLASTVPYPLQFSWRVHCVPILTPVQVQFNYSGSRALRFALLSKSDKSFLLSIALRILTTY